MARRKRTPTVFDGRYATFRTGLTFGDVRRMLWVHSPDPADWRYKRRRTVLGFWHQLKLQLWAQYIDALDGQAQRAAGGG